jgi:hypothetical protein
LALRLTVSLASLFEGDGGTANRPPLMLNREVPLEIKRRGVEMKLVIESSGDRAPAADPILLKEIARAHRCFQALLAGDVPNLAALAAREGVSDRYISLLLPLAFLAPDIIEAITLGRQPPDLTAHKLIRHADRLAQPEAAPRHSLNLGSGIDQDAGLCRTYRSSSIAKIMRNHVSAPSISPLDRIVAAILWASTTASSPCNSSHSSAECVMLRSALMLRRAICGSNATRHLWTTGAPVPNGIQSPSES